MIREAILKWARTRKPDFIIGGAERPYLRRHWLIPRNRVFNVYVHEFLRSDDDRALHDHPWLFNASWLIDGEYTEHIPGGLRFRKAGDIVLRLGPAPHRVELWDSMLTSEPMPCWTVFLTGPRIREWGFHCKRGWIHWKRFTAANDPGAVGKGCDA
jgi:hypothetical protein